MKQLLSLLLVFLLLPVPSTGAVYWVKATVNADVVGTVDTFADPYGFQAGPDAISDSDVVRFVCDPTNGYGSASASWNNRDADKGVDWDVDGTTRVSYEGWVDETTQCLAWGQAGCPCIFDFDGATAGEMLGMNSDRAFVRGIHIIGDDGSGREGIMTVANQFTLYQIEVSGAGGTGIFVNGGNWNTIAKSRFHGNGLVQLQLGPNAFAYANEFYDGANGFDCLRTNSNSTVLFNTFNCPVPIDSNSGKSVFAFNTIRDSNSLNMCITQGAANDRFVGNIFEDCPVALAYGATDIDFMDDNNFDNVTTQHETTSDVVADPENVEGGNGPTVTCDFASDDDHRQTTCSANMKVFSQSGASNKVMLGGLENIEGQGLHIGIMGAR